MKRTRSSIESGIFRFARLLQESIFAETIASRDGWLQKVDPRVKLIFLFTLILCSVISRNIASMAGIYFFSLILALGSRIFGMKFYRRVWVFIPAYTAFIAIPSLFITAGEPLWQYETIKITNQGLKTFCLALLRVSTSVSFLMLLVLTTPWPSLLKALRAVGVPRTVVFLLSMTHRYIYALLQTATQLHLGRKSRSITAETWQSTGEWLGSLLTVMLSKSLALSSEVYLAMQSRGYRGEPRILNQFKLTSRDYLWSLTFVLMIGISFYTGYWRWR